MDVKLQNFKFMFSNKKYDDDFGYSPEWNHEIEKWLSFAVTIDPIWHKKNQKRSKNSKQRDELLGEYKALYYIGKVTGCQITKIEPPGSENKKNDFSFKDKKETNWNVEVKSPSWRGEYSKEVDNKYLEELRKNLIIIDSSSWIKWKAEVECPKCSHSIVIEYPYKRDDHNVVDNLLKTTICTSCMQNIWKYSEKERAELKRKRLTKKQFINGDGRSFSGKEGVEDAVKNSIPQFKAGGNNLLITTPNMFAGMGIGMLASMDEGYQVKQIVEKYDTQGLISCICILDVQLEKDKAKFIPVFVPITNEPDI